MKKCLVCLSEGHDDAAPTCRYCGEGSWSSTSAVPASPPSPEHCLKCEALCEPCSPECFARAGYDPAEWEGFVKSVRAQRDTVDPAKDLVEPVQGDEPDGAAEVSSNESAAPKKKRGRA